MVTIIVNPDESIQAAIDSLPAEGGVVELALGTHTISSTININNRANITIFGAGMYQTNITYTGRFFQVTSSDRIILRDFGLVGGGGINLYDYTTNSVVKNIYLYTTNGDRDGIGVGNGNSNFNNNVTIQGNIVYGKPLYAYDYATNVKFDGNVVDGMFGPSYSAIDANRATNIVIKNNIVRNTKEPFNAIGIYATTNAVVHDNFLENNARGIWAMDSNGATFYNNTIRGSNGPFAFGIWLETFNLHVTDSITYVVRNNIIFENSGEGIWIYPVLYPGYPNPMYAIIVNNVIYNNGREGVWNDKNQHGILKNNIIVNNRRYGVSGSGLAISYNDVWNNTLGNYNSALAGTSDISTNPLFADPSVGDFHLKSQAGRWNGTAWVNDTENSPCLNTGDPTSDNLLSPWGGIIEIGAYGNTPESSNNSICSVFVCNFIII